MRRTTIILATYFHLPGGSDSAAFERLYQNGLKPFLSGLYRFPQVPISVYLSGPLIERLESEHPEYLMLLKEMVGRKQVEMLGGGWSTPYFPLIPLTDRLGQIEELTTAVRRMLGKKPLGCFLADGLWEQQLASTLQTAGMDYTFLPESVFSRSQANPDGPCITEDQGRTIVVLPVLDTCAGKMPASPEAFAQRIKERAAGRSFVGILVPGDASIGIEGGTPIDEAAYASFFSSLRDLSAEIDLSTPSRFLKANRERRRAYFRDSALREFITLSATAGRLYARMQYTQLQVNQLRGDKARKKQARLELWQAQDYRAYSSQTSSGLSGCRARSWAYRSILEAERLARSKNGFVPSILPVDYDFDGSEEYLYQSNEMNVYLHSEGGRMVELDLVPFGWNALNVVDGPVGLFDDALSTPSQGEPLRTAAAYEADGDGRNGLEVKLFAEGAWKIGKDRLSLRFEKRFSFRKNGLSLSFAIVNIGTERASGRYHLTGRLSLLLKDSLLRFKVRKILPDGAQGTEIPQEECLSGKGMEANELALMDERGKPLLEVTAGDAPEFRLSGTRQESGSLPGVSELGTDFSWPFDVPPGGRFEGSIQLSVHARRS